MGTLSAKEGDDIRKQVSQMGRHDLESWAELFQVPFDKTTPLPELAEKVAAAAIAAKESDQIIID